MYRILWCMFLLWAPLLSGCRSGAEVSYMTYDTKEGYIWYQDKGEYTPFYNKSVNVGTKSDALEAKLYDPASLDMAPLLIIGGHATAYQSAKAVPKGFAVAPQYVYIKQQTMFSKLMAVFGLDVSGTVECYMGVAGETAAETAIRMKAFRQTKQADESINNKEGSNESNRKD